MIILIGCIIIIVITTIAVVRSKKPVRLILAEAKYEMIYNALGSKALLQDLMMRGQNKTDLPKKTGKVALITGGARGIGLEVVKMLLRCDIHVIIGCRNVQVANVVFSKLKGEGLATGSTDAFQLDISSVDSVRKFAKAIKEKYPKIHYLINNAGIMFGPRMETRDGYESQLSTNYLGHFILTHLLFSNLRNAGEENSFSRIVNVSSCAHEVGEIDFEDIHSQDRYISAEAYAQSKLAQVLFTNYLDGICQKQGYYVQVHSVHPGIVNTDLFNGTHLKNVAPWLPSLVFKSPEQGARPIVHTCLSPQLEANGGTYIHNCQIFPTSDTAKSILLQEKLFTFTKKLFDIADFGEETL